MRKSLLYPAIAVAVAGMSFTVRAQDSTSPPPTTQPGAAYRTQDTGTLMSTDEARSVRTLFANVTESALSKDGFDNTVRRFVDADRNRIGKNELTRADWDKLNGRIEQIRKDWKAKYNQDFDIDKEEIVFDDRFRVVRGEIGEAQPAGARQDPSKPDTTPGSGSDKAGGGDANRDVGRDVAKVTFPMSHGMPALYIPLINEMPGMWKIDVPDSVDGRKLYDNLLTHLTKFGESKDQWPMDVNDAYRAASHHVFMAIMDSPMTSDTARPGDMAPTDRDSTMPPKNPR